MERPKLQAEIDADVFDSFYWYKEDLVKFASLLKLSSSGGKFEIHDRISEYLRGAVTVDNQTLKPKSKFDWKNETLTRETVVTDNYRNTRNVRNFLEQHLGQKVSFSITVMDWMSNNVGKNLGDFIDNYPEILESRKLQKIPSHNQFNMYLRDFMKDNPDLKKEDAVNTWKKVIEVPRPGSKGRGIVYSPMDLNL